MPGALRSCCRRPARCLVTLATPDGRVAQRSAATPGQRHILRALDMPEPPKFLDFTLPARA